MYLSEAASPERWRDHPESPPPSVHRDNDQSEAFTERERPQSSADKVTRTMPNSRRSSRTSRPFARGESLIEEDRKKDWDRLQRQPRRADLTGDDDEQQLQRFTAAQGLVFSLLENTGAHGIPNIKRAPNNLRKFMWTLLFFFGVGMFIWQTSWLLTRYYSFGVDTKMEISSDRMVEFPAVTVCNLNPIKSDYFDELIDGGIPLPPSLTGPRKKYGEESEAEFDDQFEMLDDAVNLVVALRYKDRRATGHLLRDMLLRCVFQGRPCGARDFTHFHHYLYGNCYIFNAGFTSDTNSTEPRRFITKAGPLYGLTLEMYIEQDQYIDDIQTAAGARVVVHPRYTMPFPEDEGVSVSPGQETFIGFKRTNYTRLEFPYSNCTPEAESEATIFNNPLPYIRYSQRVCENNCYYQNLTAECGCSDVRFRYDDSVPLCSLNKTQEECLDRVEGLYLDDRLNCSCTSPCRELAYDITSGQAIWPNENYKPFLEESFRNFSEDSGLDIGRGGDSDFLEKNVLKINVYFDKLEYTTIYHDKAYDEIALLSDMGGNVGLWIGVSVLTVFEFIELAYDLCKLIIFRVLNKKSQAKGRGNGKVTSSDLDLQHVAQIKLGNGTSEQTRADYDI